MTEKTHTPYQRGRRAAERGAPRAVPADVDFGKYRGEWLEGFDSIHGTAATRGAHYQAGQFQAWDVSRYLSGDMAQAWQYVFRCDVKSVGPEAIQDLEKALDFIQDWEVNRNVPNFIPPISAFEAFNAIEATLPKWKVIALKNIAIASATGDHISSVNAKMIILDEIARREAA